MKQAHLYLELLAICQKIGQTQELPTLMTLFGQANGIFARLNQLEPETEAA